MLRLLLAISMATTLSGQVEPGAVNWKTWVIPSANALRLPPPPDKQATADEIAAVKSAIAQRTASDAANIAYWDAGAPSYRWIQIAQQMVASANPAPTLSTRAMALVSVAMYDATVAAWNSKYAYSRPHPADISSDIVPIVNTTNSPSYPNEHAVTAGAACMVLSYLFPDQTEALMGMEAQAAHSRVLAGAAFPSDVARGMELGEAVGLAVIEYASGDGSGQVSNMVFPPATGVWNNANPVTPLAGTWKPWVLAAGNQIRLNAPPAFGSADANAQYDLVKNLARNNTTNHSAWFWQPSFIFPWGDTMHREIFENHLDANAPRAARVYALGTIAQHDATIACWDTKYTYLELRPSMADPTVATLFANPGHPGYPSGHACASQASAAVLSYLFPSDAAALQAMGTDAGMSTFYAGIHTQFDVQQGFALGGAVGNAVIGRAGGDGSQYVRSGRLPRSRRWRGF
jgi:membrane-associated phospholipid phosphatase